MTKVKYNGSCCVIFVNTLFMVPVNLGLYLITGDSCTKNDGMATVGMTISFVSIIFILVINIIYFICYMRRHNMEKLSIINPQPVLFYPNDIHPPQIEKI